MCPKRILCSCTSGDCHVMSQPCGPKKCPALWVDMRSHQLVPSYRCSGGVQSWCCTTMLKRCDTVLHLCSNRFTLWLFNIAMENERFIDCQFSRAMLVITRWYMLHGFSKESQSLRAKSQYLPRSQSLKSFTNLANRLYNQTTRA